SRRVGDRADELRQRRREDLQDRRGVGVRVQVANVLMPPERGTEEDAWVTARVRRPAAKVLVSPDLVAVIARGETNAVYHGPVIHEHDVTRSQVGHRLGENASRLRLT